jgi:pimeloyl-ACP methyl ester carboxylesterase
MNSSRFTLAFAVLLGGVVLGSQLLRAQSASPLTLSGTLREGQPGQTPYQVVVPEAWKGTLVLDLDFVTGWQPVQRLWFLDRGYAIGGITRANNEASYAMRDYVDNLLTLRRLVTEQRSAPTRTLAMGVSRGAYVALAAIDAEPDVFAGAVALSGGSLGLVARMLSKLDRTWALKSLVDPSSSLTLVNLPKLPARTVPPTPYAEDTALTALVEKARSTPIGRARLMLAAAFDQVPRWGTRNTPAPAADNLDGQLDQVVDNFGGGFNQSLRWAVETAAGGNISWNHGVDYADLLARSGLADLVAHAYGKAGGDLKADLATLAKAPRVAADPSALARAERGLLSYAGKIKGPVIIGTTVGDPAEAPSIESAYVDTVKRAGGNDLVRTIFSARPGHASWSVLERVTAFQALVDRLDAGQWGTIAQVPDMSARASRIKMASQVELGSDLFVDVRPAPALRTWDATNWSSYRRPVQ